MVQCKMASETQQRKLSCFPFMPLSRSGSDGSPQFKLERHNRRSLPTKEILDKVVEPNNAKMKIPKLSSLSSKKGSFSSILKRFKLCSKPKDFSDSNKEHGEPDDVCNLEMNDESEILSKNDINLLEQKLPPIAIGNPWKLAFSTTKDGFCLKSLYRKMSYYPADTPVLLIIQDTKGRVFGALASNTLRPSQYFYGTSQSFLFQMSPTFKVYKWDGDNFYFIKGNPDSVIFGSGNGNFGLWLDGDLNNGRTQSCPTFDSPPLVPEEDFTIKTIECWTFGNTSSFVLYQIPLAELLRN